jgi:uncharacterized coiled-coil protein SlyX
MRPANKELSIYLNDHLAGSTLGLDLAKRIAEQNEGTELGTFIAGVAREIDEDRDELKRLIDDLQVTEDRVKMTLAWVSEKASRLKLNGQLLGYAQQSRLVELESLSLGIEGKRRLWVALQQVAERYGLSGERLNELEQRAARQREGVERHREEMARQSFSEE